MVHKQKHTAHCLCNGQEKGVKAGALFTLRHHPEAPNIWKRDYNRSVLPNDSRIHCYKKRLRKILPLAYLVDSVLHVLHLKI